PLRPDLARARGEPTRPEAVLGPPVELRIGRGGEVKPATALACAIRELVKWTDTAMTAELAAVRAARCGDRAILLGPRLPAIPCATRYWGESVLVPVGFRPEPDLPPAALREAAGVQPDEILLLDEAGADVLPRAAFEPLTRAG